MYKVLLNVEFQHISNFLDQLLIGEDYLEILHFEKILGNDIFERFEKLFFKALK